MDGEIDHQRGGQEGNGRESENGDVGSGENELIKNGLDNRRADGNDLGHGLHFSHQVCRDDHSACAGRDETDAGDCQLTEYDYDESEEIEREHTDVVGVGKENAEHCANDHKFVGEGVKKFSKVGNEVVFSRNLAVQHIGNGCGDEKQGAQKGQNHIRGCRKVGKNRKKHHDHKDRHHDQSKNRKLVWKIHFHRNCLSESVFMRLSARRRNQALP